MGLCEISHYKGAVLRSCLKNLHGLHHSSSCFRCCRDSIEWFAPSTELAIAHREVCGRVEAGWKQSSKREAVSFGNWLVSPATSSSLYTLLTILGCLSYNRALLQTRRQGDILTIRLNRCQARLSIQCFDHAIEDANAVLNRFPGKEKALFRKAEALYQLRRFKETKEVLGHIISLYPRNEIASHRMERVDRRLQEEGGIYDFDNMLKENIQPVKSDRASYIGSVEVRVCKVKSRGRGLFLTKPVNAGQLLLCEKAFAVSLLSIHEDDSNFDGLPSNGLDVARDDLHRDCVFQFHRNPSLLSTFKDLHSGHYSPEEITEVDQQIILDG